MNTIVVLSVMLASLASCYGDGLLQYVPEAEMHLLEKCTTNFGKDAAYAEVCLDSSNIDEESCGDIALCLFLEAGVVNSNDQYDVDKMTDIGVKLLENTGAENVPRDEIRVDIEGCLGEATSADLAGAKKARKMSMCLIEKALPRIGVKY